MALLGDMYSLRLSCGATGVYPDEPPRAIVWNGSGQVESALLPVDDPPNRYRYDINLDSKYSTGPHWVQYLWEESGVVKCEIKAFEIVGGGDPSGTGISMEFFRRPPNSFVLSQQDTGVLTKRRNPRL